MAFNLPTILELSTPRLVLVLIILGVTILLLPIIRFIFNKYLKKTSKLLSTDTTRFRFMKNATTTVIFVVGVSIAIYMIPSLRTLSVSLFAGAGILAIIIGLASQQALSNIISGVMIVIYKPFRVGDYIRINETASGTVEDITLRHTVLRNLENKRLIIPNSVISNETIENSHIGDAKICRLFNIGISYDSSIDKAMKIIEEEALKQPFLLDNRNKEEKEAGEPVVGVAVIGYGDSSVNLRAWLWAEDLAKGRRMHWDMNKKVKERFDKEGVEIPFPYRTIVYKKDLPRNK